MPLVIAIWLTLTVSRTLDNGHKPMLVAIIKNTTSNQNHSSNEESTIYNTISNLSLSNCDFGVTTANYPLRGSSIKLTKSIGLFVVRGPPTILKQFKKFMRLTVKRAKRFFSVNFWAWGESTPPFCVLQVKDLLTLDSFFKILTLLITNQISYKKYI